MDTIHILGIAGSLRKQSYNRSALRIAQKLVPEGAEMEIIELDDLPLFNQDLENDPPAAVQLFLKKVRQADAIFFAVPEHNYSISTALKNALDWGSWPPAKSVWSGKPVAMLGAGGKYATVRAQLHLRQILVYLNMPALLKPEVYIQNAWEKFDSDGTLKDEQTRTQIATLMEAFLPWIEKHKK